MCYAVAYPLPVPGERQSRKAMLWVTQRPWVRVDDVSFEPDVKPPAGAAVRIGFGGRSVAMRMRGPAAWPHDTAALSAALRAAAAEGVAEATIAWSEEAKEDGDTPGRTYRFGLRGLVEAHAAISRACEDPSAAPRPVAAPAPAAPAP